MHYLGKNCWISVFSIYFQLKQTVNWNIILFLKPKLSYRFSIFRKYKTSDSQNTRSLSFLVQRSETRSREINEKNLTTNAFSFSTGCLVSVSEFIVCSRLSQLIFTIHGSWLFEESSEAFIICQWADESLISKMLKEDVIRYFGLIMSFLSSMFFVSPL